ncbi:MAG: hypothetical protein M1827_005977 [Pycnora praestabilis]|nr:MAG: hypothetical protein M1827_005977 [Pycnora praestabilis]
MARSDEAEFWFAAVYEAVQEIPHGKVTSYGHIARLLGRRTDLPFHGNSVPWQRVINSKGIISPRYDHFILLLNKAFWRVPIKAHTRVTQRGPSGASRQAAALREEGVQVGRGNLGELTVDFGIYGWFPSMLPSEAAEASESEEERGDHDSNESLEN